MEFKPNMIQSSLQCNRPLSHIGPWEESLWPGSLFAKKFSYAQLVRSPLSMNIALLSMKGSQEWDGVQIL